MQLPSSAHAEPHDHPCLAELNGHGKVVTITHDQTTHGFAGSDGVRYILADISHDSATSRQERDGHKTVKLLAFPAASADRWGDVPAWILKLGKENTATGLLQEELIRAGRAQFVPEFANLDCVRNLASAEQTARQKRRGLWADRHVFSTAEPNKLLKKAGHHIIAEGRILTLGKTARTRYLNFGRSWDEDLTATIQTKHEALFQNALETAGLTFDQLNGRQVRIRGYIEVRDGPLIRLNHPGQLEILDGGGK